MVVTAINTVAVGDTRHQRQNNLGSNSSNQKHPSFQGSFNPIVALMDSIDRGGFAASFILQDGLGMVAPRIYEGLNRGREIDENGKKRGPLNWDFARKEGLREMLSGPSLFLIPWLMLKSITKYAGSSNNVSIDMIRGLGKNFEEFVQTDVNVLNNTVEAKKKFYNHIFRNIIKTSTQEVLEDGVIKSHLDEKRINELAESFTAKTIEIENAKSKSYFKKFRGTEVKGSAEDLTQKLADEFMLLRKQNLSPSVNEMTASLSVKEGNKPVGEAFKKMLTSLKDFSNDAIASAQKQLQKYPDTNMSEYVQKFVSKRSGSRFISNMAMFATTVGFFITIPKIYNLGLKGNPAFKNENDNQTTAQPAADEKKPNGKDIPFEGAGLQKLISKTGDTVVNTGWLKKFSDNFEFNGPSMSVPAMVTLLFGFGLPPRYINRQDEYDGKEILVRDILSFSTILFAAEALKRSCSNMFAKVTGLALNTKPEDHNKSWLHKFKNYVTPGDGINVLKSEAITSKYSNIDKYRGGINGFFEFIEDNGGNIRKVLRLDKTVKANAESIVGKPLKQATIDEIKNAFKNVNNKDALNKIYEVFKNKNNKYVNIAKTSNSSFGFLSTLVLVPSFMIWLARYCERMTKRDRAKHQAEIEQIANTQKPQTQAAAQTLNYVSSQPTMAGFLNK